jgi:hypothetical protein
MRYITIVEPLSGFSAAERCDALPPLPRTAMPRFHFHLDDERDEQGLELADLAAVKCEALEFAARHICDAANAFWDRTEWTLSVSDEKGLTLLQLHIVGTQSAAMPSKGSRLPA